MHLKRQPKRLFPVKCYQAVSETENIKNQQTTSYIELKESWETSYWFKVLAKHG